MDALARDLVDAVRRLWRAPGLSVAVALTLGLGIGANTAVFSIVDVLYLRPLPVRDPDRVVMVMGSRGAGMFSYPNYADYREQQDVFTALVASRPLDADITTGARTEGTSGLLVTHDYFHTLGVEPTLGRVFGAGDAADDAEAVAILSERLWRRSFDGDPRWVGRTVQLKGTEVRIIGVVTPTFSVDAVDDRSVDIWLVLRPGMLGETASYRNRDANWVWMQGRLKPGVSRAEAQAAMDAVTRRLEREYPTNEGMRLSVLSELQWRLGRRAGGSFYQLLFGAVASILLLACANVTNLLLARGQARAREIAIRAALGATRRRIARQLLTESLVLSLLGGAAGWIIGSWTLAALLAPRGAANLPAGMRLDARVLAFTAALSMAAGLLSGLLPALRSARTDLVAVMKGGGWAGFRTERLPMMKSLVVGQVALSPRVARVHRPLRPHVPASLEFRPRISHGGIGLDARRPAPVEIRRSPGPPRPGACAGPRSKPARRHRGGDGPGAAHRVPVDKRRRGRGQGSRRNAFHHGRRRLFPDARRRPAARP